MGNRHPAAAEAHVHAPRKPAARPLAARSLKWSAWGLGLAIVTCVAAYVGGFLVYVFFASLPALAAGLGAGLLLIWILVHASMKHPGAKQAVPLFLGTLTFSLVTLLGVSLVIPAINDRHMESLKSPAVEAVERHRQRTGEYPAHGEVPKGLPEEVSYRQRWDPKGMVDQHAYVLVIYDRFVFFGKWLYDSRTKQWTYKID